MNVWNAIGFYQEVHANDVFELCFKIIITNWSCVILDHIKVAEVELTNQCYQHRGRRLQKINIMNMARRFVCIGIGRQCGGCSADWMQCLCFAIIVHEVGALTTTKLANIAVIQCYNLQFCSACIFQSVHQAIVLLSFSENNSFISVTNLEYSLTNYRIRINCVAILQEWQTLFKPWLEPILSIFHTSPIWKLPPKTFYCGLQFCRIYHNQ